MVPNAGPSTDVESTDRLAYELPWIGQRTTGSKQTTAKQTAATTERIASASIATVAQPITQIAASTATKCSTQATRVVATPSTIAGIANLFVIAYRRSLYYVIGR
jgi:hypothetical protein